MRKNGGLKFLTIVLALACLFQLSFTLVTTLVERKAHKIANGDPEIERVYLDSMRSEKVYDLGLIDYTYARCKENEINLGLDLRGGMNVTLQIDVRDIIVALSNNSVDPDFNKALDLASERARTNRTYYITLFKEAYDEVTNRKGELYPIFAVGNRDMPTDPTNYNIIKWLDGKVTSAIDNSYNVLRNRIDRFGVTQPNIQRLGNSGRILVELPGVKEPERVRKLLSGTASLEFWLTSSGKDMAPYLMDINKYLAETEALAQTQPEATEEVVEEVVAENVESNDGAIIGNIEAITETVAPTPDVNTNEGPLFSILHLTPDDGPVVGIAQARDTAKINAYLRMPQVKARIKNNVKLLWSVKAEEHYNEIVPNAFALYAVEGKPVLDGGAIDSARPNYSQYSSNAEVSMTMKPNAANIWATVTGENIGKCIAIVLDDLVYSAPRVQNKITGGSSQITGNFTINDATDLANVLQSGKLPAPARVVQEAVVGPSLGQESINTGMLSFIVAFILVLLYMMLYYNRAGFIASIALVANLFFLFGVLVSFGAVLTLPGIAGIVLTMGMAVDANVIIYERTKEELRSGKTLAMAVKDGYKNAYSAIIDSNLTTLITGIVLFLFGSGPVQGFATTLIIGICTSLFTSIFITRIIIDDRLAKGKDTSFSNKVTKNLLTKVKFDFMGARKYAYTASIIITVVGIVSLATRGLNMGVDFSGGRSYVIRFDRAVTADEVRDALSEEFQGGGIDAKKSSLEVKQYGNADQMRITTQYKYDIDSEEVTQEVNDKLYNSLKPLYNMDITEEGFTTNLVPYGIVSSDMVGASIASDITRNSFIAVFIALFGIGIYIAIRFKSWQWAAGGVISLFHDAFVVVALYSLLYGFMPFDLDVNQSFIAAILTVIGYSINDTVVILDRIREYMGLYPKRDLKTNVNAALNSTLSRTINTSGSTIIVLIAIFIFGGEVIRGFVFALLVGIVTGTYSSLFIASTTSYDMLMSKENKKAKTAKIKK